MPIRADKKSLYPDDWKAIRARILARDGYRCKWCRLPQYAVGYRDERGRFVPHCGNLHCDAAGHGRHPNGLPLTFREAKEFAEVANCCVGSDGRGVDDDGRHWQVIVLTVAHLDNPDPSDCRDENLAALCEQCHNRADMPMRQRNAAETRRKKRGQLSLLEAGE
jgi:5-methylcytosine-specific restriction endonuclease McrA